MEEFILGGFRAFYRIFGLVLIGHIRLEKIAIITILPSAEMPVWYGLFAHRPKLRFRALKNVMSPPSP